MEIGFIGLGKMGMNMVTRLQRDRHRVVVYDRSADLRIRPGKVHTHFLIKLEIRRMNTRSKIRQNGCP